MKTILKEAIGYGFASLAALAADMTVLWLLVRFLSVNYLVAATVSFVAGVFISYVLSVSLVFKTRRLTDRRTEFVAFTVLGSLGVGINAGVMGVAVRYGGLHYIMAKCVAAGFTFMCNFVARRQMLFARPSVT